MASVYDAARYVLNHLGDPPHHFIHIHRLLYIAQGWTLVYTNRPLFQEEIHAWRSGPIIPALYELNPGVIGLTAEVLDAAGADIESIESMDRVFLDVVLDSHSHLTASELSDIIRQEWPYVIARVSTPHLDRGPSVISLEALKQYYIHKQACPMPDPDQARAVLDRARETEMTGVEAKARDFLGLCLDGVVSHINSPAYQFAYALVKNRLEG